MSFKLFLELSPDEAEKVRQMNQARPAPLEHLFQGKDRVVFPLPPSKDTYAIKKLIEEIPHPKIPNQPMYKISRDDLMKNQARLVQKDGRTGEMVAKSVTSISRILSNLANHENMWSGGKSTVNYGRMLEKWAEHRNYWVVVSRNPIDVKRMADFKNLQSCHSLGGSHYQCTDEEVEGGGGIAFLINSEDSDRAKNPTDNEIFQDMPWRSDRGDTMPSRNLSGINPVARVRIRRAIDTRNNQEVGLVEDVVYGIENEGGILAERFKKAVRNWVNVRQHKPTHDLGNLEIQGGNQADSTSDSMMKKQYEKNHDYLVNLLKKYSYMQEDDVKNDLNRHYGTVPKILIKIKNKWHAGGNIAPSANHIFANTWMHSWTTSNPEGLLNLPKFSDVMKIPRTSPQLPTIVQEMEKWFMNSVNKQLYKLMKLDNGWVVIEPLMDWMQRMQDHVSNRLARLTGMVKSVSEVDGRALMLNAQVTEDGFLRKLNQIAGTKLQAGGGDWRGDWKVGDFALHPGLGKGIVITAADHPGGSVQIRFQGGGVNYVDPAFIYRNEEDMLNARRQEMARRLIKK